ncbi:MAG: ADP-ribose pyrophosphatase, partial [Planctomycetota bacterium]
RELRFLTTFPNQYVHHGVVAPVLDLFYVATVQDLNDTALEATEVSELLIVEVGEEHLGQMAFESNRLALEMYLRLISE